MKITRWFTLRRVLILLACVSAALFLLWVGYFFNEILVSFKEPRLRQDFLHKALEVSGGLDPGRLCNVFQGDDAQRPESSEAIQEQLTAYSRKWGLDCLYLAFQTPEGWRYGSSFCTYEAAPAPDQPCEEYVAEFNLVARTGKPCLSFFYSDVVAAIAPVFHPAPESPAMAVVLEQSRTAWERGLIRYNLFPFLVVLLGGFVVMAGIMLFFRRNTLVLKNKPRRLKHLETAFTGVFTLLAAGAMTGYVLQVENLHRGKMLLNAYCDTVTAISNDTVRTQQDLCRFVRTLSSLTTLDQATFSELAQPLFHNKAIRNCYYIPVTPESMRKDLEDKARKEGLSDYSIHCLNDRGETISVSETDFYYPVLYTALPEHATLHPGFHTASVPGHPEAMMQAKTSVRPAVTDILPLLNADGEFSDSIIIYLSLSDPEQEKTPLNGFAAVEFSFPMLIHHATNASQVDAPLVAVELHTLTAGNPGEALAIEPPEAPWDTPSSLKTFGMLKEDRQHFHPLSFFSGKYELCLYPQSSFFNRHPLRFVYLAALLGLSISLIATIIVGLFQHAQVRLEASIWRRTADLTEREETFRRLFADSTDPILLLLKGRFVDCNHAAIAILNYDSREMLLQKRITDISPKYQPNGQLSDKVFHDMVGVCVQEGHHVFEFMHQKLDGAMLPVEIMLTLIMIRGVNHIHVIWRDITQRKQAEEALRVSRERYHNLVEGLPIGLYTSIPGTPEHFSMVNKALMKTLDFNSAEELLKTDVASLYLHPEDYFSIDRELNEHGVITSREVPMLQKDGTPFWASLSIRAVYNNNGKLDCYDGSVIDITERKLAQEYKIEMERRLLQTQKYESLGMLASGIANDFNGLFMMMLANLQAVLQQIGVVPSINEYVDKTIEAARRAVVLTNQMLAYSGRGLFVVDKVNVSQLLQDDEAMLRASIPENIKFQVHIEEETPIILADAGQLQQIAINLITNSAEAIGTNEGEIHLSVGMMECDSAYLERSQVYEKPLPGTFVWLEVADTGCGMDENTMKRIFDPFFTTKYSGRGLGMSAVLGIMKGHAGALMLDSLPGQGTRVRVLFPVIAPPEEDDAADRSVSSD